MAEGQDARTSARPRLPLELLPDTLAICRLEPGAPVPPWAAEFGASSWAQIFLKFVLAHPAVTCVIPATGKVRNLIDNLGAGTGPLPDARQREQIIRALA